MKNLPLAASATLLLTLSILSCTSSLSQIAEVSVTNLSVTPAHIQTGEKVTITIDVANSGGLEGAYHIGLDINNIRYTARDMFVPPGSTESVTYSVIISEAGDYTATVDDLSQTFNVIEKEGQKADTTGCDSILREYQLLKAEASYYQIIADDLIASGDAASCTDSLNPGDNCRYTSDYFIVKANNAENRAEELYSLYLSCLYSHSDIAPLWGTDTK
ncbi:hypothetical protein ACFLX7_03760 [Chloroflexota bacterium]